MYGGDDNMNITFHYFLVKTLTYFADMTEENGQKVAFYSQMVDDFNMTWDNPYDYIWVSNQPPDYFISRKLAGKSIVPGCWWFYPVTTGISINQSFYSEFNDLHQKYTITPFHFIPTKPLKEFSKEEPRENYRCIPADGRNSTKMDTIMAGYKDMDDMKFGMMLHIFADTYAHQNFSGFMGDENLVEFNYVHDNSVEPAKVVDTSHCYSKLVPPIGHGELYHIPDGFAFEYEAKYDKNLNDGSQVYHRYNMDLFLDCAKKILTMMRERNHQTPLADNYWQHNLAPRLKQAALKCVDGDNEIADVTKLTDIWKSVFKETGITYDYNTKKYLPISVESIQGIDKEKLSAANITMDDMCDIFSEEGAKARENAKQIVYRTGQDFWDYNEIAYEHLYQVVGQYRPG